MSNTCPVSSLPTCMHLCLVYIPAQSLLWVSLLHPPISSSNFLKEQGWKARFQIFRNILYSKAWSLKVFSSVDTLQFLFRRA